MLIVFAQSKSFNQWIDLRYVFYNTIYSRHCLLLCYGPIYYYFKIRKGKFDLFTFVKNEFDFFLKQIMKSISDFSIARTLIFK